MEVVAAILIATLVGPYLIGWWIGNPTFAAAAWGALGLTVLIRQLTLDDGSSDGMAVLWIIVASTVSAGAAGYGGHRREKQLRRRAEEGR